MMIAIGLLAIVILCGGILFSLAMSGEFEPSAEEYFKKHPNAYRYVTSEGRVEVNIKALLRDPKVRKQIEACRRIPRG